MNEKKRGLGRGLNALINTGSDTENKENVKDNNEYKEVFVNISLIEPNRNQPRKEFDKDALSELSNSIKQYGILQPIIVQKMKICMKSLLVKEDGELQKKPSYYPHFKRGFNINPSGVLFRFRQRQDFAIPFLPVAS